MVRIVSIAFASTAAAQHYCLPPYCSEKHAVVGKYTMAASEPDKCYAWFFKYLNNVVPGSSNSGHGYRNTTSVQGKSITEAFDSSLQDILAAESNECGLTMSNVLNKTVPMTSAERELVEQGLRLPTGEMHQCPCAHQARAHIINGSGHRHHGLALQEEIPPMSKDELQWVLSGGLDGIFGLHTVKCAFHNSGPCLFEQIERGVAKVWAGNFSQGYHPLMDNNLMLWTPTLGPLLERFLQDGIEFFPMRWLAPKEDGTEQEMFSVLASPCGKVLYEIASPDAGGRPKEHFQHMVMSRAVLQEWNEPADLSLVPLRVSRAVPMHVMDSMLEFYGATASADSKSLGFSTKVLKDEVGDDGARAVTLRLSASATVHMQIWAYPDHSEHAEPWQPGPGGFPGDFEAARDINQVTGETLASAEEFCHHGDWSVELYTWYVRHTHEATLDAAPRNTSTLTPPYGKILNVFLDDHISWDCVAPECELAAGSRALYNFGSRISFMREELPDGEQTWWPYSHDPAGHGIELHWYNHVEGFEPAGTAPASCFAASADGTCPGSTPRAAELVV